MSDECAEAAAAAVGMQGETEVEKKKTRRKKTRVQGGHTRKDRSSSEEK